MKAISETISTVIIFSILIVTIILIFMISLLLLNTTTQTAEYGYVKTVFVNFANSLPDILEGGSYGAQIPSRTIGIGYMKLNNIVFSIKTCNETIYIDNPVVIYAKSFTPLVTANKTLFGRDKIVVNETILLGRVYEYYINGSTHIVFDTMRVYLKTYLYRTSDLSRYTVNIIYVKIDPVVITSQPSRIAVSHGGVNQIVKLIDLSRVTHENILEIYLSNSEPYILKKNMFTESNFVLINIRVVTIRVVYL